MNNILFCFFRIVFKMALLLHYIAVSLLKIRAEKNKGGKTKEMV